MNTTNSNGAAVNATTTVLIVDDRKESVSVLVDVLGRAGYRVLVAEDGQAGIAQATRALPDVILLDIAMPVLDGFDACRALKANDATKEIPVLFISARHQTADRVRGFALGGVDHITKPFRPEEVLARVAAHAKLAKLARASKQARLHLEAALSSARDDVTKRALEAAIASLDAAKT